MSGKKCEKKERDTGKNTTEDAHFLIYVKLIF